MLTPLDSPREIALSLGYKPGRLLGSGSDRWVFIDAGDPTRVIKVARSPAQNRDEWALWQKVKRSRKHRALRDWLVPCVERSPCYRVIVQERAKPLLGAVRAAQRIVGDIVTLRVPEALQDVGPRNLGVHEGRIKLCDYGINDGVRDARFARSCHYTVNNGRVVWA